MGLGECTLGEIEYDRSKNILNLELKMKKEDGELYNVNFSYAAQAPSSPTYWDRTENGYRKNLIAFPPSSLDPTGDYNVHVFLDSQGRIIQIEGFVVETKRTQSAFSFLFGEQEEKIRSEFNCKEKSFFEKKSIKVDNKDRFLNKEEPSKSNTSSGRRNSKVTSEN